MRGHPGTLSVCVLIVLLAIAAAGGQADAGIQKWAYSGTYMWYSGRGMNLDHTISQDFPIPAGGATLTFMTWYDIQTHRDYGFVSVSTDGGSTWTALVGNITTCDDPYGNNSEGCGITGKSGGWVSATFDLSAYAGSTVKLRFRYETDAAVAFPGWAIDDIEIDAVGFFDDVEAGPASWAHNGWQVVDGFLATRARSFKISIAPEKPKPRVIEP
jgi:immune inhibitor A